MLERLRREKLVVIVKIEKSLGTRSKRKLSRRVLIEKGVRCVLRLS